MYFTTNPSGDEVFLSKNGGAFRYFIRWRNSLNRIQFVYSNDGTLTFGLAANELGIPQINTWYLVTVWHDSVNNEVGIQVNDHQPDTQAHATGIFSSAGVNFILGASTGGTANFLDGKMASVGAWEKVLTESERNELFNGGINLLHADLSAGLLTSLMSYWNLDELNGTRIDSEGSDDLTDNNTVLRGSGPSAAEDSSFSSSSSVNSSSSYSSSSSSIEFSSFTSSSTSREFSSFSSSSGPNSAAEFNGVDQFLDGGDIHIMGDIDFTLSTWVYFDSNVAGDDVFLSKNDGIPNVHYLLRWRSSLNRLEFVVSTDGTLSFGVSANELGIPQINTWYLVTAWHDAANNEIGIQINDHQPDVITHAGGVHNGAGADFIIGADVGGTTSYFDGRVSMVGVWKNRILSDLERNQLFNGGLGFLYESLPTALIPSIVSYWSLDEHSGTRFDGHGVNHLSDNNGVTFNFEPAINMDSSFSSSSTPVSLSSSSSTKEFSSFTSSSYLSFTSSSSSTVVSTSESTSTSANSSSSTAYSLTSSTTQNLLTSSSDPSSASDRSFSTASSSTSSSSTVQSYTSSSSLSSLEHSFWTSSSTLNIRSTSSIGQTSSTEQQSTSSFSTELLETSSESSRSSSSLEFFTWTSSSSSSTLSSSSDLSSSSSEIGYTIKKLPANSAIGLWLRMTVTPLDVYNADDFFTIYANPIDQFGIEGVVQNQEFRIHHARSSHTVLAHQGIYLRNKTNFVRAHFEHVVDVDWFNGLQNAVYAAVVNGKKVVEFNGNTHDINIGKIDQVFNVELFAIPHFNFPIEQIDNSVFASGQQARITFKIKKPNVFDIENVTMKMDNASGILNDRFDITLNPSNGATRGRLYSSSKKLKGLSEV